MANNNVPKIKKHSQKLYFETKSVRNNIICVLIGSIVFTSLLIILSPDDQKVILCDIIEPLAAAIAAGLSVLVICKQKTDGLIGIAYTFLGAGLLLFLVAEIIWSYYEIVLEIESPFPSIADALWLIGYGPLFYFVFKMYRFYGASHSRTRQVFVSVGGAGFLVYLITGISQTADFTTPAGIISFLISISYPILDTIMLVPAALIILNPGKGELTFIPWIFLAVLIMSMGDSTFAYSSNVATLEKISWIWNLFFIASYFVISAGLFWHNRFLIYNNKEKSRPNSRTLVF
jgi:hypothetical protein